VGVEEHPTTYTGLFALYPTDVGVQHIRPPITASGKGTVPIDTVKTQDDDGFMGYSRAPSDYYLFVAIYVFEVAESEKRDQGTFTLFKNYYEYTK
jgi:hypothetical protein